MISEPEHRGRDAPPGWQAKFGSYRIAPARRQLLLDDHPVHLGGRAFDILQALVENVGEFVEKGRLFDRAWPNLTIDETNLRTAVAAVRRALREDGTERRYIETDPGRGYRLAADVEVSWERPPLCGGLNPRLERVGRGMGTDGPPQERGAMTDLLFGRFYLARSQRQLYCAGEPVKLRGPSYRALDALVARAGETIDNLTLIREVWGSLNIEESSLRAAIAALRRALTSADGKGSYIATVPRRGYRFSEPVAARSVSPRDSEPAVRSRVIGRDAFIFAALDDLRERRLGGAPLSFEGVNSCEPISDSRGRPPDLADAPPVSRSANS